MVVKVRTRSGVSGLPDTFDVIDDSALTAQLPVQDTDWDVRSGPIPPSTKEIGGWHYKVALRAPDEQTANMRGLAVLAKLSEFDGRWTGIYAVAEMVVKSVRRTPLDPEPFWRVTIVRMEDAQISDAVRSAFITEAAQPVIDAISNYDFVDVDGPLDYLEQQLEFIWSICCDLGWATVPLLTRQQRSLALYAMEETDRVEPTNLAVVLAALHSLLVNGAITSVALWRELVAYAASSGATLDVLYFDFQPLPILMEENSDLDSEEGTDLTCTP